VVAGCNSGAAGSDGPKPPGDAPTGPLAGTIDGLPFSIQSAYAKWGAGGLLMVVLSSYVDGCAQTGYLPDNATVTVITIPSADLKVGTYFLDTSGSTTSTTVGVTAAAYPRNDAGILNWADYLSSGTVWITAVSSTEISGAVSASNGQRSVDLRGAFSSPICPGQDAGL